MRGRYLVRVRVGARGQVRVREVVLNSIIGIIKPKVALHTLKYKIFPVSSFPDKKISDIFMYTLEYHS